MVVNAYTNSRVTMRLPASSVADAAITERLFRISLRSSSASPRHRAQSPKYTGRGYDLSMQSRMEFATSR